MKTNNMSIRVSEKDQEKRMLSLCSKLSKKRSTLSGFFNYLRASHINNLPNSGKLKKQAETAGIAWPEMNSSMDAAKERIFKEIMSESGIEHTDWGSFAFHVAYRLRGLDGLRTLLSEGRITAAEAAEAEKILGNKELGYDLSILPLNFLLPKEVLAKYIPAENYAEFRQLDPYGLFIPTAKITAVVDGKSMYLCSRKFKDVVLVNIHANCPIGCAGCYKGFYTREGHVIGEGLETNGVTLATVGVQMYELVKFLNKNPDIKAIVISGGEPLMAQNSYLGMALEQLRNAKYLSVIRICTGTIFQGLQPRIDDNLVQLLKDFGDETGKAVKFNAHIANHFQITPEALMAANRLINNGFTIHSQLPIQEGVSFFLDNPTKSLDFLRVLGSMQNALNIEPYKYILDMNPGSKFYVSLEPFLKVLSKLEDRPDKPAAGTGEYIGYSDLVMPRVINVLYKGGNIRLNQNLLFAMEKRIDSERKRVAYYIPSNITDRGAETIFRYEEPLVEGINDNPESLNEIKRNYKQQLQDLELR
jgi:L-lysine 2,3-aminomutase